MVLLRNSSSSVMPQLVESSPWWCLIVEFVRVYNSSNVLYKLTKLLMNHAVS